MALLPQPAAGTDDTDASDVPSGYTYLLQFIAHDLVQTTIPFWTAADISVVSRNMRTAGLQLDTLYGGGPTVCPSAFEPAQRSAPPLLGAELPADGAIAMTADDRTVLRLGRVSAQAGALDMSAGQCPFRDLPRVDIRAAFGSTGEVDDTVNFDWAFQVCIADTRNADTVILSQLTVLFSIVHNAIARRMSNLPPQAAFSYARIAVLYMYYAIIINDLLPRILNDSVCAKIVGRHARDNRWLWRGDNVPLEFSHGAFRFGHAMIRQQYDLNSRSDDSGTLGVCATLTGDADVVAPADHEFLRPLPPNWIVEWSKFFYFDSTMGYPGAPAPNFARKLAPRASSIDQCSLFDRDNPDIPDGVTLRDALSATTAQMWTIDALVAEIRIRCPDLIPEDWLFGAPDPERDSKARQLRIWRWLKDLSAGDDMMPQRQMVRDNIHVLCRDLPLSLFVLLEAAADSSAGQSNGGRLGVLGSIIVGDVIGRRLAEGRAALEPFIGPARTALGALWGEIEAVTDMPKLIMFAERNGGVSNCEEMPFIAKTPDQ